MRIRAILLGILVTGILVFAAPTATYAQAPSTLLIRGATIIDGLSDAPLQDRSLLIEGNTIGDLVSADAAPPGVQVLDLSGKFIIPGLFDSHADGSCCFGIQVNAFVPARHKSRARPLGTKSECRAFIS
jgi:adenine deaminase